MIRRILFLVFLSLELFFVWLMRVNYSNDNINMFALAAAVATVCAGCALMSWPEGRRG